jgi:hypothetical protein
MGCATSSPPFLTAQDAVSPRGPWSEVPSFEMPSGDTSIPIALLRDVADGLLRLPGAKVCDPASKKPIIGLSMEYCSTIYVAGTQDSLSWRVSEPVAGNHDSCRPFFAVTDADYPLSQLWVVGYVHNHPCGATLSSKDLSAWPTDVFQPFVAMAEVRLVAANPAPALYKNTAIQMASAVVAERQDGTRVMLRYFPTGEVQQWSNFKARWVTLGICAPSASPFGKGTPQCREGSLQVLRE